MTYMMANHAAMSISAKQVPQSPDKDRPARRQRPQAAGIRKPRNHAIAGKNLARCACSAFLGGDWAYGEPVTGLNKAFALAASGKAAAASIRAAARDSSA